MKRKVFELFAAPPGAMGLRGDRYLWEAMRCYFFEKDIYVSELNAETLQVLYSEAFEKLTGKPLSAQESFHLDQFSHGGMSSGYIAPSFWCTDGFNYIKALFYKALAAEEHYSHTKMLDTR